MKWQESWEPVCACVFVYDNVSVFVCVEGDVCKECMNNCVCVCVYIGGGYLDGGPTKILFEGLSSAVQCGEWACPGQKAFTSHVQRGALGLLPPPTAGVTLSQAPGPHSTSLVCSIPIGRADGSRS